MSEVVHTDLTRLSWPHIFPRQSCSVPEKAWQRTVM